MNNRFLEPSTDPVEDALRSFPLETAPASLAPGILSQIRTPKFELPWFEVAVSLFAAVMLTVGMYLALSLSPIAVNTSVLVLWEQLSNPVYAPLFAAVGIGLSLTVICAGMAGILFLHPARSWVRRALP